MFRRDTAKLKFLAEAINQIKPYSTMAKAYCSGSISEACKNADAIIGVTNGVAAIEKEHIKLANDNSLLLDIGKGSFSQESILDMLSNNRNIFRLSIENSLEGLINTLISYHNSGSKFSRSIYKNIHVCSGGLIAMNEEIVVDDASNPQIIYGMGDGRGDFIRNLSEIQKQKINDLETLIKQLGE